MWRRLLLPAERGRVKFSTLDGKVEIQPWIITVLVQSSKNSPLCIKLGHHIVFRILLTIRFLQQSSSKWQLSATLEYLQVRYGAAFVLVMQTNSISKQFRLGAHIFRLQGGLTLKLLLLELAAELDAKCHWVEALELTNIEQWCE